MEDWKVDAILRAAVRDNKMIEPHNCETGGSSIDWNEVEIGLLLQSGQEVTTAFKKAEK